MIIRGGGGAGAVGEGVKRGSWGGDFGWQQSIKGNWWRGEGEVKWWCL